MADPFDWSDIPKTPLDKEGKPTGSPVGTFSSRHAADTFRLFKALDEQQRAEDWANSPLSEKVRYLQQQKLAREQNLWQPRDESGAYDYSPRSNTIENISSNGSNFIKQATGIDFSDLRRDERDGGQTFLENNAPRAALSGAMLSAAGPLINTGAGLVDARLGTALAQPAGEVLGQLGQGVRGIIGERLPTKLMGESGGVNLFRQSVPTLRYDPEVGRFTYPPQPNTSMPEGSIPARYAPEEGLPRPGSPEMMGQIAHSYDDMIGQMFDPEGRYGIRDASHVNVFPTEDGGYHLQVHVSDPARPGDPILNRLIEFKPDGSVNSMWIDRIPPEGGPPVPPQLARRGTGLSFLEHEARLLRQNLPPETRITANAINPATYGGFQENYPGMRPTNPPYPYGPNNTGRLEGPIGSQQDMPLGHEEQLRLDTGLPSVSQPFNSGFMGPGYRELEGATQVPQGSFRQAYQRLIQNIFPEARYIDLTHVTDPETGNARYNVEAFDSAGQNLIRSSRDIDENGIHLMHTRVNTPFQGEGRYGAYIRGERDILGQHFDPLTQVHTQADTPQTERLMRSVYNGWTADPPGSISPIYHATLSGERFIPQTGLDPLQAPTQEAVSQPLLPSRPGFSPDVITPANPAEAVRPLNRPIGIRGARPPISRGGVEYSTGDNPAVKPVVPLQSTESNIITGPDGILIDKRTGKPITEDTDI